MSWGFEVNWDFGRFWNHLPSGDVKIALENGDVLSIGFLYVYQAGYLKEILISPGENGTFAATATWNPGKKPTCLVVYLPTPLKNDGLKVGWDDDIPFPTVSGKSCHPFHGSSHHQPVSLHHALNKMYTRKNGPYHSVENSQGGASSCNLRQPPRAGSICLAECALPLIFYPLVN